MHKSVFLREALECLRCEDKRIIVDCTIGGAGHAYEILKRLPPGGRLIGIDADKRALEIAEEKLREFKGHFVLVHKNFRNLDMVLRQLQIDSVDAVLFDLGISSFQLEDPDRGFSFTRGGSLDMRIDLTCGDPLWERLKTLDVDTLGKIIRDLGEERFWRKIAAAIVAEEEGLPIRDSLKLADLVRSAVGYRRAGKIDTATRTFQALRIFTNDELGALKEALGKVSTFLRRGGRIVVISFHSLEDRIVKNTFKRLAQENILKVLTKKPMRPSEEEIAQNPRSRSARLRAAQRL